MPEVKGSLSVTGELTEAGQRVFSPNNLPPSIATEDFDAITASGLYRNTTTGAVGAPTASVNWLVQVSISNANNATQLAIRDGRVAVRTKIGVSTYGAWRFLTDDFTETLPGMVPASGGGTTNFLRADGTFAAPPAGGGGSPLIGWFV